MVPRAPKDLYLVFTPARGCRLSTSGTRSDCSIRCAVLCS